MLGVVDSFMVGKLGAEPLAASALANGLFFLIMVLGIGMSHAITALVAIAVGEKKEEDCGVILRQGLIVNMIFGDNFNHSNIYCCSTCCLFKSRRNCCYFD